MRFFSRSSSKLLKTVLKSVFQACFKCMVCIYPLNTLFLIILRNRSSFINVMGILTKRSSRPYFCLNLSNTSFFLHIGQDSLFSCTMSLVCKFVDLGSTFDCCSLVVKCFLFVFDGERVDLVYMFLLVARDLVYSKHLFQF